MTNMKPTAYYSKQPSKKISFLFENEIRELPIKDSTHDLQDGWDSIIVNSKVYDINFDVVDNDRITIYEYDEHLDSPTHRYKEVVTFKIVHL